MGQEQCKFIESIDYRIPPCYPSDEEWEKIKKYIVKHSKQLIDLIEVGDFINGFPILEPIYNGNTMYGIDEGYENFKKSFGEIKTILTGESYMANCYKVGGEENETSND